MDYYLRYGARAGYNPSSNGQGNFMGANWQQVAAGGRARSVGGLLMAAAVTGCLATGGNNFSAVMQKTGAPAAGMSRVVLYPTRDADATTFQLDGVLVGQLKPGTFTYRDVPAGGHEIVAEPPATGTLERYGFSTTAGRTLYLKVDATDLAKWRHECSGRASVGFVCGTKPSTITGTATFKFVAVNDAAAARELADMILLTN
jgi:hypothetical protein